jgi:hypothetical protein
VSNENIFFLLLIIFIVTLTAATAWDEKENECCSCGGEHISWRLTPDYDKEEDWDY